MTELLGDAEYSGSSGNGDAGAYTFTRSDGSAVSLVYTISGAAANVKVNTRGMQAVTLYNVMGNRIKTLPVNGDSMTVAVSAYPLYAVLEQ